MYGSPTRFQRCMGVGVRGFPVSQSQVWHARGMQRLLGSPISLLLCSFLKGSGFIFVALVSNMSRVCPG